MVRKPGRMYRDIRGQAYTRKKYMGGVPASKIVHFDDGDLKQVFPVSVSLVAKEHCQIRHSALEAARVAATKYMSSKAGTNYKIKVRVYPHNVLRENKQAVGAGADRISQGMRASFGKAVGTAARVQVGQKIMTLSVLKESFEEAKDALRRARMKLPTPCTIVTDSAG